MTSTTTSKARKQFCSLSETSPLAVDVVMPVLKYLQNYDNIRLSLPEDFVVRFPLRMQTITNTSLPISIKNAPQIDAIKSFTVIKIGAILMFIGSGLLIPPIGYFIYVLYDLFITATAATVVTLLLAMALGIMVCLPVVHCAVANIGLMTADRKNLSLTRAKLYLHALVIQAIFSISTMIFVCICVASYKIKIEIGSIIVTSLSCFIALVALVYFGYIIVAYWHMKKVNSIVLDVK